MNTINNTLFSLIALLFLCVDPLQATQSLSTKGGTHSIDVAPVVDYQPIAEKGVDKFEEYLLLLQKKCSETEKIKKGVVLLLGTTGSGKSTLICDLLGVSLIGIRSNNDESDDSDDEGSTFYTSIDIDPNNRPKFLVPKIGHNKAQAQTFLPGVFTNPNVKNGLHYCDMPGFDDTRGSEEKAIAAIAPALVLQSAQSVQAILAVINYANLICAKGNTFLKVITDIMTYFGGAPWPSIKKATFVCITQCAHVSNQDVKQALKDQIGAVYQALAKKQQAYNKAIKALKAHYANQQNLDEDKKKAHQKTIALYTALQVKAKFFSIFSKIETINKKIVLDKKKLLFSKPLHKNSKKYRTKIIEALKSSPGLKRDHLSKCDYSNPTLTYQLNKIVGRMNGFFSKHKDLKSQNEELKKSISSEKGIAQQIKKLEAQITATSLELSKEKKDTSLVAIYKLPPYHRTFSGKEKLQNWGLGILEGVAAAHGVASHALFTAVSGTVFGGAAGGIDKKKQASIEGFKGLASLGTSIVRNPKPYKRFAYRAFEPVYEMRVCYGAGTFKSTSPDEWQVNEESDIPINHFTYRPTNVSTNYPVAYVFEYIGYFHTDGHCQVILYSKYNELQATKKRMQNLAESVSSMQETIKTLTKDKKSKEKSIASNAKEIERLDRCITNTYEKRAKGQKREYSRAKCEMLAFFASKPLFNKGAAMPKMNDDNDQKVEEQEETDHPLPAEMNHCITEWRAWLSHARHSAQADAHENKLNDHHWSDDEVFDID